MKNLNKKNLRGFTLIELIVVMAVFSILLVGAIALVEPVQKIFKHTTNSEKTYSYINTVQNYIEDSLTYAENLWVYQELDEADLLKEVEKYRSAFYRDVIKFDGTTPSYISGTIRVLCLENDNNGRISLRTFNFKDNEEFYRLKEYHEDDDTVPEAGEPIPTIKLSDFAPVQQLNESYFTKSSGKQELGFRYALGINTLKKATDDASGETVYCLSNDRNNVKFEKSDLKKDNFTLSIAVSDQSTGVNTATDTETSANYKYTTFSDPTQIAVASIPLMNINYDNVFTRMKLNEGKTLDDAKDIPDGADEEWEKIATVFEKQAATYNFIPRADADDNQDLNKNIYFIYSYVDEIES